MSETHHIAGTARGEPLPEGRVGARVCENCGLASE